MRYTTALPGAAAFVLASLAAPAAAALFDREACNGIGACTQGTTCNYDSMSVQPEDPEWDCGSAGTITGQLSAGATLNFWMGLSKGQVVPRADFPTCDPAQPSDIATLLVRRIPPPPPRPVDACWGRVSWADFHRLEKIQKSDFKDGITVYGWIEYQCKETEKFSSCYSSIKNPSLYVCPNTHFIHRRS